MNSRFVMKVVWSACVLSAPAFAESPQFIPVSQQEVRGGASDDASGVGRLGSLYRVIVRGKEAATVVLPQVRVSDLADVSSSYAGDDELVIAIKNAIVGESPAIGEESTFTAAQVLEVVRDASEFSTRVGYLFPRVMKVTRASRTIGVEEVTRAISAYIQNMNKEAKVLQVSMPRTEIKVSPRSDIAEILPIASTKGTFGSQGTSGFQVKVQEGEKVVQTFNVQATVQEWGELPVARRHLTRGEVVEASDVTMARVNLTTAPLGIAQSLEEIVGQRIGQDMPEGALFRTKSMVTPPVVHAGERVSLLYRSKLLEASASAVALESGVTGGMVRVRNEASKRVLQGIVTAPGIVEVRP